MTAYQETPSLEQPKDILANCIRLNPQDGAFMRHPVIESNGHPNQSIYVDESIDPRQYRGQQIPLNF